MRKQILAVGRERTEEEKRRRHLYGDKGGEILTRKEDVPARRHHRMRDYAGYERQFDMRDI